MKEFFGLVWDIIRLLFIISKALALLTVLVVILLEGFNVDTSGKPKWASVWIIYSMAIGLWYFVHFVWEECCKWKISIKKGN